LTIHEQEPAGGTRVGTVTAVKLFIYRAESEADSGSGERRADVEVPNVVGLSAQAARNALREKGYRVEIQAAIEVPAARRQAFTIRSQSPPAKTRIQPAGTITIRVYPGFEE
jgi:beta-lactam-binding protein with PASTA domain